MSLKRSHEKKYQFYDSRKPFNHSDFFGKVQAKNQETIDQLQDELYKLSKNYICTQLDSKFFVPQYLDHNKLLWANMFLGQKQIQGIFLDFHLKLQEALKLEMNMNKQQLQNYLSLPNQDQLDQLDKKPFQVKTYYIDNIPKIIKRKEKEFLDNLKKKIMEDEKSYKQYDLVVKEYGSFTSKMDALKNLNGEFQKQDFLKKNLEETYSKINQIKALNNKIEETNLELGNNLDTFLADSEREVLKTRRPGDKLHNMLEQWEREVKDQCWSRDELEFYSGELWLTAEQYEKELQEDIKGFDLEKSMIHRFYRNKCEQLKQKFMFQDEIQLYIDQQEGLKLRSMHEAQEKFNENLKVMKAMKQNLDNAKKEQLKEYNLRINLEVIKDDYFDKIQYLNSNLLFIIDNFIMVLDTLKLADSGIILDMKQQRQIKEFDFCVSEKSLENIVDNIKTISLSSKLETILNYQKNTEVRNQKVVNFIQDIKSASHNSVQIPVNDNFKKGLKEILHCYEELITKKMSLNSEKQNDKLSTGKQGSAQNLGNSKLGKKILGKGMGKQIQSPKSPSQLRNKRAKFFMSEIDKIPKKDQLKDYSAEIQEIAVFLINHKDIKFELIGIDLNSLRNLDQLLAAIQGFIKSIQYDESMAVKATDVIHIDEHMFNPQIFPLKMLLFQNEKEQIQKIQTTNDLHYSFIKSELEHNLTSLQQSYPSAVQLVSSNLEKQHDTHNFLKHFLQRVERQSTNKSDKGKQPLGTPSSQSPPKRQTTKILDDPKAQSQPNRQIQQARKSTGINLKSGEELTKKNSSSMIQIFNQKASPMRKASQVPNSQPLEKIERVGGYNKIKNCIRKSIYRNSQEGSKSSRSNHTLRDNNKSILSNTEQSQSASPKLRLQQMKQSIITTQRESEIGQNEGLHQPKNNRLIHEIQKLNSIYRNEQGNNKYNSLKSNEQQSQKRDQVKQKKQYEFLKSDVGINTNIQMRDLEIILTVKKEAKHTIQALEKLLEEQLHINEQIQKKNQKVQLVGGGPLISTASETNDTEDEAFNKYGGNYQGNLGGGHWKYSNQFPERSSNKFHPNANRNLKLRSNRVANEVKLILDQYQTMDGSVPRSARGGNQMCHDEIPVKSQDIKFINQTHQVFERRKQLQRKKLFSQELIQQTQEKLVKFQQNSHRDLQVHSLKENSVLDEIVFPNDSTMIMQKINAQIVEFNPQGTLVAIGCKYASILIMDFMTKEMIRCFSIYEDYDLEANQDVDQFSNFRRLSYAYLEDDFILYQKPQDEKESESIVKREFKKVIQFEPKDKPKCKAQISSLDWSLDGRYLVACFRIENQVAVWDVLQSQKLFHMHSQEFGCQINQAKFHSLNPNYLLLSGEKALVVRVKQEASQEIVIASDNLEEILDSQGKQEALLQQQQQNKRKGPKFSSNIFQTLISQDRIYYLMVKNDQKVIMLLEQRDPNEMVDLQPSIFTDFFRVSHLKPGETEKTQKDQAKIIIEQDESLEYEDERDILDQDDTDNVKQAIESINQHKFKIISMVKFQSANSFVQSLVNNDDYSNLLMTFSDRVLRLYEIKYQNIGVNHKRVICIKNEFQDVINRRKWMNACFLKLNQNTRIVEQQSQNNKTDAVQLLNESRQLLYSSSFNQKNEQQIQDNKESFMYQQEIFVSSIGESGSNELKFYNVDDFSIIQRLELTQEGCSYLTAHSKSHFSIFLVTTNGSLFLWSVRPAKIIQPLAPYFTEIEENKEYVEREDEFEKEISDSDEEEEKVNKNLDEDQIRKRKLAKTNIDIDSIDNDHLSNFTQYTARRTKNNNIESLFDKQLDNMDFDYQNFVMFLPIQVNNFDTFGLLAKLNVDTFREKFNKLQQ
ncbi:UNKNOWN [Stylonychia lemnae]|uniref:Uncharacterized protein n=1 Tax=Stylonychia lemnae TaxID=5949 RepID=A0A078ALP0_STYLE|nr:UNKNOWN [Stylonychia lemnae]|eukprot:CDW83144.1 UNKNOWN [Stylonychia lemnae]